MGERGGLLLKAGCPVLTDKCQGRAGVGKSSQMADELKGIKMLTTQQRN